MRIEIEKKQDHWIVFRTTVDDKKIVEDIKHTTKEGALIEARRELSFCLECLGEEAVAKEITIHEGGRRSWVK